MTVDFTDEDTWHAPFYELHVEIGPHPASVATVLAGIEALWRHPSLDGPYGQSSRTRLTRKSYGLRARSWA